MKKKKQQLVLNKGTEKFIFRYDSGSEDKLLDALVEQAKDKRTNFDWFDAAVLSFKLAQSLINQADSILGEKNPILQGDSQTQEMNNSI
ncbi:MAG: hypothetical protein WC476_00490 [Phycisphaerae bacterium]